MTNEYISKTSTNKLNIELQEKKFERKIQINSKKKKKLFILFVQISNEHEQTQFNRSVMFLYILRVIFVREEKKKREMKHRVAIKINKYRWANKKNKKKRGGGGRGGEKAKHDTISVGIKVRKLASRI